MMTWADMPSAFICVESQENTVGSSLRAEVLRINQNEADKVLTTGSDGCQSALRIPTGTGTASRPWSHTSRTSPRTAVAALWPDRSGGKAFQPGICGLGTKNRARPARVHVERINKKVRTRDGQV